MTKRLSKHTNFTCQCTTLGKKVLRWNNIWRNLEPLKLIKLPQTSNKVLIKVELSANRKDITRMQRMTLVVRCLMTDRQLLIIRTRIRLKCSMEVTLQARSRSRFRLRIMATVILEIRDETECHFNLRGRLGFADRNSLSKISHNLINQCRIAKDNQSL